MEELDAPTRLSATEAGVRLESVYRRQFVTHKNGNGPEKFEVNDPDRGSSRAEVAKNLQETFLHIYDFVFQDSLQHAKVVDNEAYHSSDLTTANRDQLRTIFLDFAAKHYDEKGTLTIKHEDGPAAMQELYENIRKGGHLHNSGLARGALIVEMGRGEKWKKIFPQGIDFTRGEPSEELNLTQRFKDAFFNPDHPAPAGEFTPPPESLIEIAGVRFAKKMVGEWRTHLVTQTGHVVDLTDERKAEIEAHIKAGKPLDELRVTVPPADAHGHTTTLHLLNFEEQPIMEGERTMRGVVTNRLRTLLDKANSPAQSASIDGLPVRDKDGKVRLMVLDVDLLTGLSMKAPPGGKSELTQLKDFMARELKAASFADLVPERGSGTANVSYENTASREFPLSTAETFIALKKHVAAQMGRLEQAATEKGDTALVDIVRRATPHLEAMMPRILASADKQFIKPDHQNDKGPKPLKARTPVKQVYMAMGGSASGKGALLKIAQAECADTLVVASLDDARGEAKRYWLYPATNNHNDDYKGAEQYANTVRDLVTKRAMQDGYNLYIDGSGIPYEDRNDKITAQFKKANYQVSVLAAQAPLFVRDPARGKMLEEGQAPDDAYRRLGHRLSKELRAVKPEIVAEKHIGFALATRNAARDRNVDRFMIIDSTPRQDQSYTLAYVLTLDEDRMRKLVKLKGAELKEAILAGGPNNNPLKPKWAKLPENHEDLYAMKVIRDNHDSTYRVEMITDIEQYIGMVEKGLLNRHAKGPNALHKNTVHGDVKGYFMDPEGMLNTKQAKWVERAASSRYAPLAAAQEPRAEPLPLRRRGQRPPEDEDKGPSARRG